MRRVKRLLAWITVALLLGGLVSSGASAASPSGPRLAFVEWKPQKPERITLVTAGPSGTGRLVVPVGPGLVPFPGDDDISWLPDGSRIAATASKPPPRRLKKGQEDPPSWIYVVDPGTGRAQRVPGTRGGQNPVVSPDGTQVAFSRYREAFHFNPKNPLAFRLYMSTSTWIASLIGGKPRRITPWRNGLFEQPSSYSPDGAVLALDRDGLRRAPEAVAYHLDSGRTTAIARNAENPVYSPDGSRIALASYRDGIAVEGEEGPIAVSELYLVDPDGSNPVRLTHSRKWQEFVPSWDPSGQRLVFIRSTARWALGMTNVVMEINPDGTCPTLVLGKLRPEGKYGPSLKGPGLYAPTWQPGPDHAAGPIPC